MIHSLLVALLVKRQDPDRVVFAPAVDGKLVIAGSPTGVIPPAMGRHLYVETAGSLKAVHGFKDLVGFVRLDRDILALTYVRLGTLPSTSPFLHSGLMEIRDVNEVNKDLDIFTRGWRADNFVQLHDWGTATAEWMKKHGITAPKVTKSRHGWTIERWCVQTHAKKYEFVLAKEDVTTDGRYRVQIVKRMNSDPSDNWQFRMPIPQ